MRKDSSVGFNHCRKKKSSKAKALNDINHKAIPFFDKDWQIKEHFVIPEKYKK